MASKRIRLHLLSPVVRVQPILWSETLRSASIEPDGQFSRVRLSDKTSGLRPREALINEGHTRIIDADLADYFGSIPHAVHSADEWDAVLKPVVARYQGKVSRIYFRADAGSANPEVIGYLLKRPVGRPPNEVRRLHANFS
jgi:hypothetical protein